MEPSTNTHIHVLVVEDLQIARIAINQVLTKLNCKVDSVANAAETLQQILQGHYDIIFIDIHLPGLNGLSLAETIRSIEQRWNRIPLIAFTASDDPTLEARSTAVGFDDFLLKPVTVDSAKNILLKHLNKYRLKECGLKS